jgi:uncharacterized membrane protein YdbT with pleckstrin-like domain
MGSYVQKSLIKDENLVFETEYHWIIYFWGSVFFVIGLVVGLSGGVWWILIFGTLWLLYAFITQRTSEFAVTNKRVIIKVGWISRRTIELNLSKVESVDVSQGIFARMFGWGEVTVVGIGASREPFRLIAKPLEFRRAVQSQQT